MTDAVLILGATGRAGRAIAQALDASGVPLVLAGRDRERLGAVGGTLAQTPRLLVGQLDGLATQLASDPPAVVVNTVGPFASTAATVIDALPPGTHYLDLSNEYAGFEAVLNRDGRASAAGQVLVAGAGFGVVVTESVLIALCAGQPTPTHVRVDALPSLATEADLLGAALAGSIVDGLPLGRRQVRGGRLVTRHFDDTPAALSTPDGEALVSVNFPSGDLLAAWRDSGAPNVVAGSSEVPSGTPVRLAMPLFSLLTRAAPLRRMMARRLAQVTLPERARPRPHSWGHAQVRWADGTVREGWVQAGDAMDFTVGAAAEVARRLHRGEGRPGAYTPCALFGSELAEAAGGVLMLDPEATTMAA